MAGATTNEYMTIVNGYTYVVTENGSIVPVLKVNEIDTCIGKVKNVTLRNWADFDSLEPRVGNKVKLIYNNFGLKEVIKIDNDFSTTPIPRPDKCPICNKALHIKDKDANSSVIRCDNEDCGYYTINGILRYLRYCSLVDELTYIDVARLFLIKKVTNIAELYNLTVEDLTDLNIDLNIKEDVAEKVIDKIDSNRKFPMQNLLFAMLPKCKPNGAVKLASMIGTNSWKDPILDFKRTVCVSKRDTSDIKFLKLLTDFNREISLHKKTYEELMTKITVTHLLNAPIFQNKIIVIGNITSVTKSYLENVIKLVGGRVEDNFSTIAWGDVAFIISDGLEMNQNITEGIELGTLVITENEFRAAIAKDMKYANEPNREELNKAARNIGLVVEDDIE